MALFQPISSPDSHFLQKAEFLQLPLMVKDEAVTAGPPASQVLLSPHVGYRGVQHTPAPSLHACGHRHSWGDRHTAPNPKTWLCLPAPAEYLGRGVTPTWAASIGHTAEAELVDSCHAVAASKER